MKKLCFAFLLCISAVSQAQVQRASLDSLGNVYRFAFGSCNHQGFMQEMWYNIMEENAQLWVWLGDNIYGNTDDTTKLRKKYNKQLNKELYSEFISKIPQIGIWDDHDYGINNCDSNWKAKRASQQLFLDFVGEPADSPRRKQLGIYTSYEFGQGNKKIKFILLDTRYFRPAPCDTGDLLGEAQWIWLENELRNTDASVNFICTSTQFLSDKKKNEKWADYPHSKDRMLKLIKDTKVNGVVFLSGDIHCAEILRYSGPEANYPIYEFTSSGLTHSQWYAPQKNKTNKVYKKPFCGKNFGLIQFSWDEPASLKLEIRSIQNFVEQEISIYLEDLKVKE